MLVIPTHICCARITVDTPIKSDTGHMFRFTFNKQERFIMEATGGLF